MLSDAEAQLFNVFPSNNAPSIRRPLKVVEFKLDFFHSLFNIKSSIDIFSCLEKKIRLLTIIDNFKFALPSNLLLHGC